MADPRTLIDPVIFADPWLGGVAVTVTPPSSYQHPAIVIFGSTNAEFPPGAELAQTETRKIVCFRRSEVPSAPRGTVIAVSPLERYVLDTILAEDGEVVRAVVRPA